MLPYQSGHTYSSSAAGNNIIPVAIVDLNTGDQSGVVTNVTASTATVTNGTSTTVLAANTARKGFYIQNLTTNLMYVKYGSSASSSSFTVVLKACAVAGDGTGGTISSDIGGVVYTGIVTASGTGLSYTVTEF